MSSILASEKRVNPRYKADQNLVEISLTYPKGSKLLSEVLDINDLGLSFKMYANQGFLSPGTLIKELKIFHSDGKKPKILSGIVRYASPFHNDGESCYKIGLEFIRSDQLSGDLEKTTVPFPIRPKRYSARRFFNGSSKVVFYSVDGKLYSGKVIDFSKYGVAIELDSETPILRISDTLKELKIIVKDETIFSGEGTIARLEKANGGTLLGIAFKQSILDITKAVALKMKFSFENEFNNFLQFINGTNCEIENDFKAVLADTRYFLEKMKIMLDQEEVKIGQNEADADTIRRGILENISKDGCAYLYQKMKVLQQITERLDPFKQEIYRAYFRHHLHSLLLHSPFLNRTYSKPLGYAGDYQVMNFLYKDGVWGRNLFAMFLDGYSYSQIASRSVMNRVPFLIEKLSAHISKMRDEKKKEISICSIGSGPAKEIQELIKKTDILNECSLTLIDFESEALLYTQEKILDLKTLSKGNFKVKFIQKTVTKLLTSNAAYLKNHDIVYTVGLFDYLGENLAKLFTRKIYKSLNPSGLAIIGNMDTSNDTRFFMEYATDWYLYYRTMNEMFDLARDLKPEPVASVESEDTGTNNFLIIHKP